MLHIAHLLPLVYLDCQVNTALDLNAFGYVIYAIRETSIYEEGSSIACRRGHESPFSF